MDAFKIFTSKAQENDSDSDNSATDNKFGAKPLITPYRDGQIRSRDLNLSHSRNARGLNEGQKSAIKIPEAPSSTKLHKFNINSIKPCNTLDAALSKQMKNNQNTPIGSSSEEKAGNENQENNNANYWEEQPKVDYKKAIEENKMIRESIRSSVTDAQNSLQNILQSARRKVTELNRANQNQVEPVQPIIEESAAKSEQSDARSGIIKTRKTLNFDRSESSGSKLIDLSATPISIAPDEDNDVKVSKFQEETEVKVKKKEHKSTARTTKQNFVRINTKRGYCQKDRRVKTRLAQFTNKRKRILNEMNYNMNPKCLAANGGFGEEGLDGAYVSEYMKENKVIPIFSPKFTDDFVRSDPLDVPQSDEEYLKILKEKFGFDSFYDGQLEAIKSIIERQESCLAILSTGGGKSLIYQYCSLFMKGLIVIITPLISLMTDQLQKLPKCISGCCFNSYQTLYHKRKVIDALSNNKISVIFLSPERLMVEDFKRYNQEVSMVCIDEIHCSSEWSHNFRPSYLKLEDVISNRLQCSIILGLTATATKDTEKSLISEFDIK